MKSLLIAGTVITTKEQAQNLIRKLNLRFLEDKCYEMATVIDDYTERLISAGFLTWDEAEALIF